MFNRKLKKRIHELEEEIKYNRQQVIEIESYYDKQVDGIKMSLENLLKGYIEYTSLKQRQAFIHDKIKECNDNVRRKHKDIKCISDSLICVYRQEEDWILYNYFKEDLFKVEEELDKFLIKIKGDLK